MNVTSVRIERRGGFEVGVDHPFSEVFIIADGKHYCTRLFHTVDDSPFARAEQAEQFKRRIAAGERSWT